MIKTMLSSPEHEASMRVAGIYGHLLHYAQVVQAGGAAPRLPGEGGGRGSAAGSGGGGGSQQLAIRSGQGQGQGQSPSQIQQRGATEQGNERAMNYFSACLRILELEEEVALTGDSLKAAYKKAVIRAHPDKGGSEKEFEAVTRAYAYLGEIIRRIHGGRATEGKVEAPTALQEGRTAVADKWKMVEPVALNPDKLNMKSFNDMYEKTRIPDPEEAGYGDWLKGGDDVAAAPKFSGKFNRDVFNREFEGDAKGRSRGSGASGGVMTVQEQSLANRLGYATELGRTARDDYTVAAHDKSGLIYTDLKKAYTEYNTFSQETANVSVSERRLEDYTSGRDKAPPPLADHEMAAVVAAEKAAAAAEEKRRLRVAQESVAEDDFFNRMKRMVIRNA